MFLCEGFNNTISTMNISKPFILRLFPYFDKIVDHIRQCYTEEYIIGTTANKIIQQIAWHQNGQMKTPRQQWNLLGHLGKAMNFVNHWIDTKINLYVFIKCVMFYWAHSSRQQKWPMGQGEPDQIRIILYMRPIIERWHYSLTPSLIGRADTQNGPCRCNDRWSSATIVFTM